jgi:hypothetical protein
MGPVRLRWEESVGKGDRRQFKPGTSESVTEAGDDVSE